MIRASDRRIIMNEKPERRINDTRSIVWFLLRPMPVTTVREFYGVLLSAGAARAERPARDAAVVTGNAVVRHAVADGAWLHTLIDV